MPRLTQEIRTVVETEPLPELTLTQQQQLLREIAVYEALADEADENKQLLDAQKQYLNQLRADMGAGAKTVSPGDGFLLTLVGGESSSLDKKGLMKRFAITPAAWAEFVKKKPKKPYLLVTTPATIAKDAAKAKTQPRDERDEEDDRE